MRVIVATKVEKRNWAKLSAANHSTAFVFYDVHAGGGDADDGVDGCAIGWGGGKANAGAHGQLKSVFHAEACRHQRAMQCAGLGQRFSCVGVRHEDDKLVAAVAETIILFAAQLLQALSGASQQLAAHQVAVSIIHQLETVQVDESQRSEEH